MGENTTELYYDERSSVYNKGKKINVKSFDEIKLYLDRMDQYKYTEVNFGNGNEYISVGGGNNEYIVFVTIGSEHYNLLNNDFASETEEMDVVAGGQKGCFPQKTIVNYDVMASACKYYSQTTLEASQESILKRIKEGQDFTQFFLHPGPLMLNRV